MSNIKTNLNFEMKQPQIWLFWTIATTLGWTLVVYPGFTFRGIDISSWQMLPKTAWDLFLSTLALGLFIGLFQYLILRLYTPISVEWIIISTFSYALGSALALLLIISWLGLTWPETLAGTGTTFVPFPLALTMLIGGCLTGLIQAYAVKYKYTFMFQNKQKILLWVLASALSWGLGFFAAGYAWGAELPVYLQSGISGLVIGAITGAVLLLQLEQKSANQ